MSTFKDEDAISCYSFGHLIVLLSPNSHHTSYNPNQKWTCLNATPLRRLSIMKLASQESSLKAITNYPTIYGGKATWFQTQTRIKEGIKLDRSNSQASSGGQSFTEVCDARWRIGSKIGRWKGRIISNIGKVPRGRGCKTIWKPEHM